MPALHRSDMTMLYFCRRAEAQNAFSKDGREEDSFHYDVRQLGPPPAVKLPQAMQPEAPGQTWRASAAPGVLLGHENNLVGKLSGHYDMDAGCMCLTTDNCVGYN